MRNERDEGEDAARKDEVDDVVERFSTQMNREHNSTERSLATVVPDLANMNRNACTKSHRKANKAG